MTGDQTARKVPVESFPINGVDKTCRRCGNQFRSQQWSGEHGGMKFNWQEIACDDCRQKNRNENQNTKSLAF